MGPDDIVVRVHACGICGSDLHGYRAELWVEPGEVMGHEWTGEVVDVGRWSRGAQADVVVEAAGTATTLKQALEMVRHRGTVVQIALFEQSVALDPTIITQKQIRLQGCAGGERFGVAADLVRTGRIQVKPFITHHFPLAHVTEAFETQMRSDEWRTYASAGNSSHTAPELLTPIDRLVY